MLPGRAAGGLAGHGGSGDLAAAALSQGASGLTWARCFEPSSCDTLKFDTLNFPPSSGLSTFPPTLGSQLSPQLWTRPALL